VSIDCHVLLPEAQQAYSVAGVTHKPTLPEARKSVVNTAHRDIKQETDNSISQF